MFLYIFDLFSEAPRAWFDLVAPQKMVSLRLDVLFHRFFLRLELAHGLAVVLPLSVERRESKISLERLLSRHFSSKMAEPQ